MKSSAIPVVGDCGFSFFISPLGGVFSGFCVALSDLCVGFSDVFEVGSCLFSFLKALNVSENLDRSFRKDSICSESFNFDINGFTLSAKSGFCER